MAGAQASGTSRQVSKRSRERSKVSGITTPTSMTGEPVPVLALRPGDKAHLEPHRVWGQRVLARAYDVLITRVRGEGEVAALDYQDDPDLLGASPTLTGTVVYETSARVMRIGHAA